MDSSVARNGRGDAVYSPLPLAFGKRNRSLARIAKIAGGIMKLLNRQFCLGGMIMLCGFGIGYGAIMTPPAVAQGAGGLSKGAVGSGSPAANQAALRQAKRVSSWLSTNQLGQPGSNVVELTAQECKILGGTIEYDTRTCQGNPTATQGLYCKVRQRDGSYLGHCIDEVAS